MQSNLERFRQRAWVVGVSLAMVASACAPLTVPGSIGAGPRVQAPALNAPTGASAAAQRPAAGQPAAEPLSTSVKVTASEFKFTPNSLRVPLGQPVTITLENKGVVEHDIVVSGPGFHLAAGAGKTASAQVTFRQPGTFEFICSLPGHKDAGMKGTLTVVDPNAPAASQPQDAALSAAGHDMPGVSAPAPATAKPLPAGLQPLPAPQMAPPITRTEPAFIHFDLTTQEVTATLADGVATTFWTFNGTVPGPMLRVREGDTVEIALKNDPTSLVTHSIDLHAVTGPGGGAKVMQIAPGEEGSFRFQALNPGVYVYHCATPMVAHHIASGMYGLIVVEPKDGYPRVDREFYVMQGDFYLQGERGTEGLRDFALPKMLDEKPDYILFNGGVGAVAGQQALKANVGETVRIFFGVGGPNLSSSFHVIGEIFDRVYPEGATDPVLHNVQTTHVPAGGATIVEFKTEVPGNYTLVDHSLGRLEKGAAGVLEVSGAANPAVFESLHAGSGGSGGH